MSEENTAAPPTPAAPFAVAPQSEIEAIRENVTMMALCGQTFGDVHTAVQASRQSRQAGIEAEYQQRLFAGRARMNDLDASIAAVDATVDRVKNQRTRRAELLHEKKVLEQKIAGIRLEIARKRSEATRIRMKAIVERVATRVTTAEQRLVEEQRARDEKNLLEVQRRAHEVEERLGILRRDLAEIEERLAAARVRLQPALDRKVTRMVAGFLLWVGYASFAGIGSAVALLLPHSAKNNSPLSDVFVAMQVAIGGFPNAWPVWAVFLVSTFMVLMVIAAFAGIIVLNDLLMRKFDPGWLRDSRRASDARSKRKQRDLGISTNIELRRASYVQLLASLPYVVATVAIICLLAASRHAASGTGTNSELVATSVVSTYLGSILALLVTSSFVMYIIKVLEPGANDIGLTRTHWKQGWEFLVIPAVLIVGTLYAAAMGKENSEIWGPLVLFMLLSCLATAYGVVYRGLFNDVDYLERERRRCLQAITDVQSENDPGSDEDETLRELRQEIRRRRDELENLDDLN